MSEADAAEAEGFLREILVCFPVLGLYVFEKPSGPNSTRRILFIKGKGIQAKGYDSSEGFVVVAKSQAVTETVPSVQRFVIDLRDSLMKSNVLVRDADAYRFTQDYVFDSPSTAADVVLGRSANGRQEWRDSDGRSLKQLQEEERETPVQRKS
jgi:hypothetical protein